MSKRKPRPTKPDPATKPEAAKPEISEAQVAALRNIKALLAGQRAVVAMREMIMLQGFPGQRKCKDYALVNARNEIGNAGAFLLGTYDDMLRQQAKDEARHDSAPGGAEFALAK